MLPNAFDMHAFLFGVLLVITGAGPAGNAAMGPQDDYWSRIEAMAKKRVPGGNPELLEYLRSLSRDQMLVAARQCAAKIQKVQPVDTWGPAVGNVWLALRFYGKPHEIPSEEVAKLSERAKRGLAARASDRLSDESLEKLAAIIENRKEADFLRFAIAQMLDGTPWHLTDAQLDRAVTSLTAVLCDRRGQVGKE